VGVVSGVGCSSDLVCCALNVASAPVNGTNNSNFANLAYQSTQALASNSGSPSSGLSPLEIGIIVGACFVVLIAVIIVVVVIARRRRNVQSQSDDGTTTTYHRA